MMKKWLTLLAMTAGLVSTGNAAYINRLKTFTGVASQWPWQLNADGTWTMRQPAASDLTNGTTGTGAVVLASNPSLTTFKADSSNASFLSSNLGPSGLNWVPFDAVAAASYMHFALPGTHTGALYAAGATLASSPGSGAFGPASADIAHFFAWQKDLYLTNNTEGEGNTLYITARQGHKGDVSAALIDVAKVLTGTADTGGVLGTEQKIVWLNSSGTVLSDMHALTAVGEGAGGYSSGAGYGFDADARRGQWGIAFHADSYNEYSDAAGTYGWKYLIDGASNRLTSSRYFAVRGDVGLTGAQVAGEIIQGLPGNSKILRTTASGVFQIRNDADASTLFSVSDAGAITLNSASVSASGVISATGLTDTALSTAGIVTNTSGGVLGTVTGTTGYIPYWSSNTLAQSPLWTNGTIVSFNYGGALGGGSPFGVHIGTNQNLVTFGNVNSGPAWVAVNDANNAYVPLTFNGSSVYLQANGTNVVTITSAGLVSTGYNQTGAVSVGSLPACAAGLKGARYFVTDANATTFASTVAAGGANDVPVVCNGTNWIIG